MSPRVRCSAAVSTGARRFYYPYGTIELGKTIPPTPTDNWEIGSVTKVVTALVVAAILERTGAPEWFLQERVVDVFPVLKTLWSGSPRKMGITVEELLTHSSGLEDSLPPSVFSKSSNDVIAFFEAVGASQLKSTPGTSYSYSNIGFGLAGLVAAEWGGAPWEWLVSSTIVRPLGIAQLSKDPRGRDATGYRIDGGKVKPAAAIGLGAALEGAGELSASAESLLDFVEALRTNAPRTRLSRAIELIKKPRYVLPCPDPTRHGQTCEMALALMRNPDGTYSKGGTTPGFNDYILFSDRYSVVVMTNSAQASSAGAVAVAVMKKLNELLP